MLWILLSVLSAIFLGVYDAAKKTAVHDNAVPAVLFYCVLVGGVLWLPLILLAAGAPQHVPSWLATVADASAHQHLLLLAKSALVAASWTCAYFALKHLPISIAAPIRATSPMWTIAMATLFMQERPSPLQWLGILVILSAFFAFSIVGRREGIHFHRDRWVALMVGATLLGACSALYDKFLLQRAGLDPATVQAWFSVYLVVVLFPLYLYWWRFQRRRVPFTWRWAIPVVTFFLLTADYLYFAAIAQPGAMIAIISPVRRSAVVISFLLGIRLFGEVNFRPKAVCIVILMIGVFLVSWSS
jgi:drug/metabolite transporter (DMT)-like permease